MLPYYRGFNGTVSKIDNYKYLVLGCYNKMSEDKIKITELPVGCWTLDYKQFLEKAIDAKKYVKDYKDLSTDKVVEFHVIFHKGQLEKLLKTQADYGCNGLQKYMKLMTTKNMGNMYLFNHKEQLKKYECVEDIITDYFPVRWEAYKTRKAYILDGLKATQKLLSNKARYINELLEDTIDLRRKKKEEITMIMKVKKSIIQN